MKLSEKGVEKISKNCKNVMVIGTDDFFPPTILEGAENLEFDQSDFTGAVVLTVEEAKDIKLQLNNLAFITEEHFRCKPIYKLLNLLRDRIEQSEREHE